MFTDNINQSQYQDLIKKCCTEDKTKQQEVFIKKVHVTKKVDLNDYEEPEEDKEANFFSDIANIYLIYHKDLHQNDSSTNMFNKIDFKDDKSINQEMGEFYEAIDMHKHYLKIQNKRYTDLFDKDEYIKLYSTIETTENYDAYLVTKNKTEKVTHSLLSAITYIAQERNWHKIPWSIKKMNIF